MFIIFSGTKAFPQKWGKDKEAIVEDNVATMAFAIFNFRKFLIDMRD